MTRAPTAGRKTTFAPDRPPTSRTVWPAYDPPATSTTRPREPRCMRAGSWRTTVRDCDTIACPTRRSTRRRWVASRPSRAPAELATSAPAVRRIAKPASEASIAARRTSRTRFGLTSIAAECSDSPSRTARPCLVVCPMARESRSHMFRGMNSVAPQVSVIVPVRDAAHDLAALLDCLEQPLPRDSSRSSSPTTAQPTAAPMKSPRWTVTSGFFRPAGKRIRGSQSRPGRVVRARACLLRR